MDSNKIDVIIPVADKDISFVKKVVTYIRRCIVNVDVIYIITAIQYHKKLKKLCEEPFDCVLVDENNLIPILSFNKVKSCLQHRHVDVRTGWYFQQFLKYGFAQSDYAKKYYLSWDADTLPLSKLCYFNDGHPVFTKKFEYNPNYFKTIEKLTGLSRQVDYSFIAEHMLFNPDIMKELLGVIDRSEIEGKDWVEKIINACDFTEKLPPFSEFETYGTYVMSKYPDLYLTRQLNTFRYAGFIKGRLIDDKRLRRMSFDLDCASFELGHEPVFPYNMPNIVYKVRKRLSAIFSRRLTDIPRYLAEYIKTRKEYERVISELDRMPEE